MPGRPKEMLNLLIHRALLSIIALKILTDDVLVILGRIGDSLCLLGLVHRRGWLFNSFRIKPANATALEVSFVDDGGRGEHRDSHEEVQRDNNS